MLKARAERRKKYNTKSACKRYIRDFIDDMDELEEVKSWIEEKEKELKNDKKDREVN